MVKKIDNPPLRGKFEIPDPTITKPLNEHSTYDIGYYCDFLNEDMNTVFKHECFGTYKDMEYNGTEKFGVMIREESISITNALRRIGDAKPVDWTTVLGFEREKLREYVNDEDNYIHLFN